MLLADFMKSFAEEMELGEGVKPDEQGVYSIPLEEKVTITAAALPTGFKLSSPIAPSPQKNKEAFYTELLLANLFGQGTHGGSLGISEDGNLLTLSQVVEYSINYKEFRNLLEDFINTVDFWREEAIKNG